MHNGGLKPHSFRSVGYSLHIGAVPIQYKAYIVYINPKCEHIAITAEYRNVTFSIEKKHIITMRRLP